MAGYFCKYVAKDGESGRPEITETVQRVEVGRRRVVYVSQTLTARTRCTMRNLRLRRYYWHGRRFSERGSIDCDYAEDMASRGLKVLFGRIVRSIGYPSRIRNGETTGRGEAEVEWQPG